MTWERLFGGIFLAIGLLYWMVVVRRYCQHGVKMKPAEFWVVSGLFLASIWLLVMPNEIAFWTATFFGLLLSFVATLRSGGFRFG